MATKQPSDSTKSKLDTGGNERFSWKGKQITVTVSGDSGAITIDGKTFAAKLGAAGMWSSPGVFNQYRALEDLARHIVDYLHLFTPSG
jgi:hypothetical protein